MCPLNDTSNTHWWHCKMNFAFSGDFKRKPQISLGGTRSSTQASSLIEQTKQARLQRQLAARQLNSAIILQSRWRARTDLRKARATKRSEYLLLNSPISRLRSLNFFFDVDCDSQLVLNLAPSIHNSNRDFCNLCIKCLSTGNASFIPILNDRKSVINPAELYKSICAFLKVNQSREIIELLDPVLDLESFFQYVLTVPGLHSMVDLDRVGIDWNRIDSLVMMLWSNPSAVLDNLLHISSFMSQQKMSRIIHTLLMQTNDIPEHLYSAEFLKQATNNPTIDVCDLLVVLQRASDRSVLLFRNIMYKLDVGFTQFLLDSFMQSQLCSVLLQSNSVKVAEYNERSIMHISAQLISRYCTLLTDNEFHSSKIFKVNELVYFSTCLKNAIVSGLDAEYHGVFVDCINKLYLRGLRTLTE